MNLQNKVAVVTGASRGLGHHFAKQLAERGATVYGLARSKDDLDAVRDDIGDAFHPIVCDMRDADAVDAAVDRVMAEQGRIDVLINNAGLGRFGPVDEQPIEEWHLQVDVNLNGVHRATRRIVPVMKAQNADSGFGGHIVNIASVAGLMGNPNLTAYNATKFALRGYTEALMKEVRQDGIKVTCVYPGSVATHFADESDFDLSPNAMRPEDVAATVLHTIESPDNYLISEVVMRPLRPKG